MQEINTDPSLFFKIRDFYNSVQTGSRVLGTMKEWPGIYFDSDGEENYGDFAKSISFYQKGDGTSFCCGGIYSSKDNKKIYIKIGNKYFNISDLKAEDIIPFCQPAPFGDIENQITKIDKNVRVAYQADMKDITFKCKSHPDSKEEADIQFGLLDKILYDVKKKFYGSIHKNIELVPYRLNVYGKDNFFKKHVDTPKDPEKTIGTLVLIFPTPHQGGDLTISHQNIEQTFNFNDLKSEEMGWIAFYSDCVHEVKKITEGHRISMTFNINKYEECKEINNDIFSYGYYRSKKLIYKTLPNYTQKILDNVKSIKSPRIGIILNHDYTLSGLNKDNLKGFDKTIYSMFSENYECKLVSVIYKHYKTLLGEYENGDTYGDEDTVYLVDDKDWKSYCQNRCLSNIDIGKGNYRFISCYSTNCLIEKNESSAGFTGNEYETGHECYIYFTSALLIDKGYSDEEDEEDDYSEEE